MGEMKETFLGSPRSSTLGVGVGAFGLYQSLPPEVVEYLGRAITDLPHGACGALFVVVGIYLSAFSRDAKGKAMKPEDHN